MLIAHLSDGVRTLPKKNIDAYCPQCYELVVAKMGKTRAHHWAHKESTLCSNSRQMTMWHCRWIMKHHDKAGWQIEYQDLPFRYDCFNESKKLVLEIQSIASFDYIVDKTKAVVEKGFNIKWIFHSDIFDRFIFKDGKYTYPENRMLSILDILEIFAHEKQVSFYVDTKAWNSEGKSSKGLIKLLPHGKLNGYRNINTYFKIPIGPI